jgi:hypothetical protein
MLVPAFAAGTAMPSVHSERQIYALKSDVGIRSQPNSMKGVECWKGNEVIDI